MLEPYAAQIESCIEGCVALSTYSLRKVHLSPNTGYVEGEVTFVDASRLIFFVFLRQQSEVLTREKYRYHFMDADNALIFRYDNAPHHDHIDTFPHHKHLPDHVTASLAPDFAEVFAEAEMHVLGLP